MSDAPWSGDACGLVDAFRAGDRSPLEELDATLAAIEASDLNAFAFVDVDRARTVAESADVSLPFGGVPTGIKELEQLEGWPDTEASLVFADRIADHTSVHVARLLAGGAVPVGTHHGKRVRRSQRQCDETPRRHPQPVAAGSIGWRIVGWVGSRRRRWPRELGERW